MAPRKPKTTTPPADAPTAAPEGLWPAQTVEMVDIGEFKRNPRNSRTHPAEQIEAIAAAMLTKWGFTIPILWDEEGTIIAGHGRLEAAELNLKRGHERFQRLPAMRAVGWTEEEKAAYVIWDNKSALMSGWDNEALKGELGALQIAGFDMALTGFSQDEMTGLFKTGKKGGTDPDDVPEPPPSPITRRGELWLLGDHRLLCGDSTDPAAVDRLMAGQLADLLWSDPPWNVNYGSETNGGKYKDRTILNDSMTPEKWQRFVDGFTACFKRFTRPGAAAYVVMSAQEWPTIDGSLRKAGFHWSSTIIWAKDTLVLSRKDYHTRYEPMWYGWNDAGPRLFPLKDRKQDDVWEIDRPKTSDLHPTTKPVALIERSLMNSSARGSVVMDLFGGSGSVGIACEQTDRRARLMELDPRYCDVITQRWCDFTGQEAYLESGQSWTEAKAARTEGPEEAL